MIITTSCCFIGIEQIWCYHNSTPTPKSKNTAIFNCYYFLGEVELLSVLTFVRSYLNEEARVIFVRSYLNEIGITPTRSYPNKSYLYKELSKIGMTNHLLRRTISQPDESLIVESRFNCQKSVIEKLNYEKLAIERPDCEESVVEDRPLRDRTVESRSWKVNH